LIEAIKSRILVFRGVLFAQILFLVFTFFYISVHGRLPQPFQNVLSDTFMDFFNTNWWAYNSNRYLEWKSTYPPLIFSLAKIFVPKKCIGGGGGAALRECSVYVLYFFIPIYAYAAYLSVKIINKLNSLTLKRDQLVVAMAILISMPFLYTMERMNYLILSYIFLCLYLLKHEGFLKYLFFGIAVNIKPYLLVLAITHFIRGHPKRFAYCLISSLVFFFIGKLILKDESSIFFISNMFNFGKNLPTPFHAINFQTTFHAILSFLTDVAKIEGPFVYLKYLIYLVPILAFALIGGRIKKLKDIELDFLLLLSMLFSISSLGGYSVIFLIPFFSLCMKNNFKIFLLLASLLIPLDFVIYQDYSIGFERSYISAGLVNNGLIITTGALLRPAIIGIMMVFYVGHIRRDGSLPNLRA